VNRLAAVLLLALVALAGCGGDEETTPESRTPTVTAAAGVEELANVLDLRSDFEADAGKTRVIVLFSPT
jgi:ABC-type glycerol-3-phosphate transport system substrate-binding protein